MQQVYVAEAGYMLLRAGVPKHAIITQLAGAGSATSACAYACRGSGNGSMVINSQACWLKSGVDLLCLHCSATLP